MIQYSGWHQSEMGLLGSVLHSWGSWALTLSPHSPPAPHQEKSQAETSLGLELFYFEGGVTRLNYSSLMHLNMFCSNGNFSAGNLGLIQSLSCPWVTTEDLMFSRGLQTAAERG